VLKSASVRYTSQSGGQDINGKRPKIKVYSALGTGVPDRSTEDKIRIS
jgi:hypothetical protein